MSKQHLIRTILLLALPVICSNIFGYGINMMDTLMAGGNDESLLVALNVASQFYMIFYYFALGTGNGAAIIFAKKWGEKKPDEIQNLYATLITFLLFFFLLFLFVSLCFPEAVCSIFTSDPQVIKEAAILLRYLMISGFFLSFSLLSAALFRSIRWMKIIFLSTGTAFVIKLILNVILFSYAGDHHSLLLHGIGITNIAARIIEAGTILYYLLRRQNLFHIACSIHRPSLKHFLHIGVPVICSDTLLAIAQCIIAMMLGMMGTSLIAANSVISLCIQMTSFLMVGIAASSVTLIGNALGEQSASLAKHIVRNVLYITITLSILNGVLMILGRDIILSFFQLSSQSYEIARTMMVIAGIVVIFTGISYMNTKGILRAYGDTKFLFRLDFIVLWFIVLPLSYLIGIHMTHSAIILYLLLRMEDVIKAGISFLRLRHKVIQQT